MKVIQMRFFQNNRISLYKIKKSRLNRDHFTIGAVEGVRTLEMPEPQSGVLASSPRPPSQARFILHYSKRFVKSFF